MISFTLPAHFGFVILTIDVNTSIAQKNWTWNFVKMFFLFVFGAKVFCKTHQFYYFFSGESDREL